MRQRTSRAWLVALVLFLGLLVPLTRAMGQEGSPSAADASPSASATDNPAASDSSIAPGATVSTTATTTAPAGAKSPVVFVDGLGNGVVHTVETESTSKGAKANITGGLSVPTGLAVVSARMSIPDAKDGKGQGYLEANAKKLFGVGNFTVTLPDTDNKPLLDFSFAAKQDGASSTASGTLSMDVASDKTSASVSNMSLDGDGSMAGYKTSQLNLHFTMGGTMVKDQMSGNFKAADIKIAEADGVTTVTLSITVPGASSMAGNFKQLSASPSTIEGQVKQFLESKGFNVQTVKLSNVHATPDEAGAELTIAMKDFRKTVQTLVRAMLASKSSDMGMDPATFEKSVDELLQLQLDSLELKATTAADKFDARLTLNASNVDKFVLGYVDVYTALLPAMQKMQSQRKQTPLNDLMLQSSLISLQHFRTVWEQGTANSTDKSQFKFNLTADLSNKRAKLNGKLDGSGDLKSFVQAAKANNYPMMDSQYALIKAKSDGKQVSGSFYVDASGNWFDAIKAPYAEAAKTVKGMEELATILPSLQFQDARMALNLGTGDLTGNGYVQLSDLTPVVKAALEKNAPSFKGDFVAVNFVSDNPAGTSATNTADMFMANLPKSDAEVKTDLATLGSLGSIPVQTATDPGQTKPPALNKPNVEMPSDLKVVVTDSQKELGISSIAVPGMPGGKTVEGSQTNMLLLVAGIVLIIGIAVFAVGKGGKKS